MANGIIIARELAKLKETVQALKRKQEVDYTKLVGMVDTLGARQDSLEQQTQDLRGRVEMLTASSAYYSDYIDKIETDFSRLQDELSSVSDTITFLAGRNSIIHTGDDTGGIDEGSVGNTTDIPVVFPKTTLKVLIAFLRDYARDGQPGVVELESKIYFDLSNPFLADNLPVGLTPTTTKSVLKQTRRLRRLSQAELRTLGFTKLPPMAVVLDKQHVK